MMTDKNEFRDLLLTTESNLIQPEYRKYRPLYPLQVSDNYQISEFQSDLDLLESICVAPSTDTIGQLTPSPPLRGTKSPSPRISNYRF